SGVTAGEAQGVIESICQERNSDLRQLGRDFSYNYQPGKIGKSAIRGQPSRVQITTPQRAWPVMELGLLGEHQAANAAVAVACLEPLRESGLRVEDQAVQVGLARVNWPARMEVLRFEPLVMLDCAHNVASAQALVHTLRSSFPPAKSGIRRNGAISH